MTTPAAEEIRALIRVDWVVPAGRNQLHHVELTDSDCVELEDNCWLEGPIRLTCGRTVRSITIPGVLTRMGAPRCSGCCRATGLPPGVGSPKNDSACRVLLGLP